VFIVTQDQPTHIYRNYFLVGEYYLSQRYLLGFSFTTLSSVLILAIFSGDIDLLFCKGILTTPVVPTAIAVLLFSYAVETGQYLGLVYQLGLQHSRIARTIIGTSFRGWTL